MNILLLAHNYMNLALPIIEELERQGHSVVYIEDKCLASDCYHKNKSRIVNRVLHWYNGLFKIYEKYWEYNIRTDERLSEPFDLLFVIQGLSFHHYLLKHLQQINPMIKTSLYIWDTNKYYDFFRNIPYFDKVFTFDLEDSHTAKGVVFLPFYWIEELESIIGSKYDISIIGTDHDGRYDIVKKIYDSVHNQLSTYFRIVIPKFPFDITSRAKFLWSAFFKYKRLVSKAKEWQNKIKSPIVTFDSISQSKVSEIIKLSNCVLDTDRDSQTGITPRVIWALAMGKKIISTNTHLLRLPFINKQQVRIIDRKNPIVDVEFVKSNVFFERNDYILHLRIDRWVQNFIE